jgi:hypothetical protein
MNYIIPYSSYKPFPEKLIGVAVRSTRADGKSVNSSSFNVAVGRLRIGD